MYKVILRVFITTPFPGNMPLEGTAENFHKGKQQKNAPACQRETHKHCGEPDQDGSWIHRGRYMKHFGGIGPHLLEEII